MDGAQILRRLTLVLAEAAAQELGEAEDGIHRRADLVAHVGEELALRAVGGLGFVARQLELHFLLLELGNVLEAHQDTAGLRAGAEHRRAVDDESTQRAGRRGQAHEGIALHAALVQCRAPGQLGRGDGCGVRGEPSQGARIHAGERLGRLAQDLGDGLVRKHDTLIAVQHQQAPGQRVERSAHAAGNGARRVEMTQHAPEIQIESDQAQHEQERAQHDPGKLEHPAQALGDDRPESQLELPPAALPAPERHLDLAVGRRARLELHPGRMLAGGRDQVAARIAHRHRKQIVVALDEKAQHRLESPAIVGRDERRARRCNALGERDAAVAHGSGPIGQQAGEDGDEQRRRHDGGEAERDMGAGGKRDHDFSGTGGNGGFASAKDTKASWSSSRSSSSSTRESTGSGSIRRHAGRLDSRLASSAPPRSSQNT